MKIIRHVVIAVLILSALGILAFGPRANEGVAAGFTVVDYWEKWTGAEEAQMRLIVNDFNKTVGKEKHIFVRYVSTSSVNQKTLVATAGGVPPDVAGLWDTNLVQFATLDALEPLEDMAAAYGITEATYKPVYWKACNYKGHLYALISTPAATALHYNTKMFQEKAAELRAAGLDPTRPPRTIDELDAYSRVFTKLSPTGRILVAGYLPMEPGWFLNQTYMWFGGKIWDEKKHVFTLTDPKVVQAYTWIQSYSKRLGKAALSEFHSGVGNFDSPQNSFLTGTIVMEQQGPWMANLIATQKPSMKGDWAAAPFPSAVPGLENVAYCGFDTLTIPRGAKHKKEAFEFIAYVNRQDVMEKLCSMHCKNSPLAKVSENFIAHHPNPYIKIFEKLACSPNAHGVPQIPILPEVYDELTNVGQRLAQLETTPQEALQEAQVHLQEKYDRFMEIQRARHPLPN